MLLPSPLTAAAGAMVCRVASPLTCCKGAPLSLTCNRAWLWSCCNSYLLLRVSAVAHVQGVEPVGSRHCTASTLDPLLYTVNPPQQPMDRSHSCSHFPFPCSYPFLLVDRVIEWEKEKYAIGYKNVTINDNFFTGHFPERPIMPGEG